jgi:hypothetical protein
MTDAIGLSFCETSPAGTPRQMCRSQCDLICSKRHLAPLVPSVPGAAQASLTGSRPSQSWIVRRSPPPGIVRDAHCGSITLAAVLLPFRVRSLLPFLSPDLTVLVRFSRRSGQILVHHRR